jgi:hypothetical protein
LFITWITLDIFSSISVYLAYNLLEDIGVISTIYQNSITYSVLKEGYDNTNRVKLTKSVLFINVFFSSCILILLSALFSLYISYKVIDGKWEFSLFKKIFGIRYYYYMKIYSYGSKMDKTWMI